MTMSGSIWYTEGPMVRVEGALPKAAADLIVTKGGFYNAGAWWIKRENWPSVKTTLELMGIAIGTGLPVAPSKIAEFTTTSMGDIAIYGDLPRNLDPTWLGRTRARGYFGLSPWALEEAMDAFRKEGIEPRLDAKVLSILEDVRARKEVVEGLLDGPLPVVRLANGELWEFQRETVAFAAATGGNCLNADEPGLGKAQPLSEPVLTPSGWKTMGDLQIGDEVVGVDGLPTMVVGVYPQGKKNIKRIVLSDGSFARACVDHLWEVKTHNDRVRETSRIVNTRWISENLGARLHLPTVSPIHFSKQRELPLHPYLLGVLLGDGGIRNRCIITTADDWIRCEVEKHLPVGVVLKKTGPMEYSIRGPGAGIENPVIRILRDLGLFGKGSWEKAIPERYLLSSTESRLSLLQGLMDTDGWARDNCAQFCTTSPFLRDGIIHLIRSLGGIATLREKSPHFTHKGVRKEGRLAYVITAKMPKGICPFALPRKANRYQPSRFDDHDRRIEAVIDDGEEACVCIAVSSSRRLYVTRDFLVTHNTVQAIAVSRYFDAKRVVVLGPAISKFKWAQEIAKFDDSVAVIIEGKKSIQIPKDTKYVVLNYDILPDHLAMLSRWEPDMVVMDESHLLKNREAKRTQAAKALCKAPSVRFRFPMTGTPIWNNVIDLHSQLDLVQDGWWGHTFEFGIAFANGRKDRFGWQFKGSSNETILNQRLKYVMTRHLKKDVLKDLPLKTRLNFPVALQSEFARQYAEKWKEFTKKGKEISGSPEDVNVSKQRGQLLAMLQQLRMLSSQGRVASTIEYVKEALEEQRAVVVFCYFTEAIDALNAALRQSDVRVAVIDGSVPPSRRQQIADDFQAGKLDVVIGQVQAAGTAIDLFRGDLTVHHDISWVPAEQVQAEDRVNRMGQKRGTEHVYMVGRDTVDQRVIDRLLKKMAAAKSILDLGEPMDEEALRDIEREFFG